MLDKEQIVYKIKHFLPYIFGSFKGSGYRLLEDDDRDFQLGSFFGLGAYSPKSSRVLLPTLSVKDQNHFNTCVFNSATVCKEPDEGVILSVRSLVSQSWRSNYIQGNGNSSLRYAQQVLKDWGEMEEKDLPDGNYSVSNDFNGYVNTSLDQNKASGHKISSFWSVSTKDQILQLLDQGRRCHVAIPWYSGYNQGGGFSAPWIITKALGYFVGGHALAIIGYDLNYQGHKVFIIQNSYSAQWGDAGKFYVEMDFLVREMNQPGYGCYCNLDLGTDTASFINKFDSKNVKKKNNPSIYLIQSGVKKVDPDWPTYLAFDGNNKGFTTLSDTDALALDKIQAGDNMDITKSVYWSMIEELKLADDKDGALISAITQMQYNKRLGLALDTNLR
jgi:hypothetical protein